MLLDYYEWFVALAVFCTLAAIFFFVSAVDFFRAKIPLIFRFLVLLAVVLALVFLGVFFWSMWYVLLETSFIYHIYNGDLLAHLSKVF